MIIIRFRHSCAIYIYIYYQEQKSHITADRLIVCLHTPVIILFIVQVCIKRVPVIVQLCM